jgi:hypothetical protein
MKLLPHDQDAERAIVGGILLRQTHGLEDALNVGLDFGDFYDERLRDVFKSCLALANDGRDIDLVSVKSKLTDQGLIEKIGVGFLADLTTGIPFAINIPAHAVRIRKLANDRRELVTAQNFVNAALAGNGDVAAARGDLEKALRVHEIPGQHFKIGTAQKALLPQPEIDWVLREFIARRWVSLWFGEPGCKKTWAILDQAVCVAMGKPWLGFKSARSTVHIVDEESGEHRLLRRLGDVMRAHQAPADIPVSYTSLHGFNLSSDQGAAELEALAKETRPDLIIVDAFADLMLGGDENSVQDTQPIFVRLRRIAERQDCAIEVVHHVNKAGGYRGSTALKGAVDSMLLIESAPDSPLVNFTAEKSRDVIIRPFGATAHFDVGSFRLIEAEPGSGKTRLSPSESYVMRYLEQGPATVKAIIDHADVCSGETARRAVYALANRELIHRIDSGGSNQEATYAVQK